MINPINFKASVSSVAVKANEVNVPEVPAATNPISNEKTFKGADALANYNKAMLVVEPQEGNNLSPAFKGDGVQGEETVAAPAFKGDEVQGEETVAAPAFKGDEVKGEETVTAPAFKGDEVQNEETPEVSAK